MTLCFLVTHTYLYTNLVPSQKSAFLAILERLTSEPIPILGIFSPYGIKDQGLFSLLGLEFLGGIPEVFIKIGDLIIYNFDSFIFQQLLHKGWAAKMHLTC